MRKYCILIQTHRLCILPYFEAVYFSFCFSFYSREAIATTINQQKVLINDWKYNHLGENNIQLKITKLRQVQVKLESDEDYDEAALVNQKISELMNQCDNYKYQHPILDQKVCFPYHLFYCLGILHRDVHLLL